MIKLFTSKDFTGIFFIVADQDIGPVTEVSEAITINNIMFDSIPSIPLYSIFTYNWDIKEFNTIEEVIEDIGFEMLL